MFWGGFMPPHYNYMSGKIILLIIIFLFSNCASVPQQNPEIWVAKMSDTVTRYYIPATTWQERVNRMVSCRVDITYVNEPERQVVCNISFFNKNAIPNIISSIYFMAGVEIYPLNNINNMFTRMENNELRITSVIEIEQLFNLFQSENISLRAVIDSVEYTFVPNTYFLLYSKQFSEMVRSE